MQLPSNAVVRDNACGAGVMTEAILRFGPDASITATDASVGMIHNMDGFKKHNGWGDRVSAEVVDWNV